MLKKEVDDLAQGVVDAKKEDLANASLTSEILKPLVKEAISKAESDLNRENQKISE